MVLAMVQVYSLGYALPIIIYSKFIYKLFYAHHLPLPPLSLSLSPDDFEDEDDPESQNVNKTLLRRARGKC